MEAHQKWIDFVAKSNTKFPRVYTFNSSYLLNYFYMYCVSNPRQLIDFCHLWRRENGSILGSRLKISEIDEKSMAEMVPYITKN